MKKLHNAAITFPVEPCPAISQINREISLVDKANQSSARRLLQQCLQLALP